MTKDSLAPRHPLARGGLLREGRDGPVLRRATADDLPAIVALLTDDPLGAGRESADLAPYRAAFAAVDADPAHLLVVAEDAGAVVGTLQLSFLPGLSRGGALRAQVEGVRVAAAARGCGLGEAMLGWVAEESRRRGAALVQLTTDTRRPDAHRFYERLGYVPSHVGMKLELQPVDL
ncbi:acetyltransferase (GNAT) family protein [Geodermatophilus normandii]|uniref:Acetyltransferase (GNAT) family protein n=1 Tax=Geodermatophilus normandii TaxID=1137989 RepID=A0A317QPS9_9ACTN|nr:GNAT family N-acetyltransferase [Geodermatophilus normandii]PWW25109.1 acetyltransferase (GNAT) family protein [Geodermatophilus normandii]